MSKSSLWNQFLVKSNSRDLKFSSRELNFTPELNNQNLVPNEVFYNLRFLSYVPPKRICLPGVEDCVFWGRFGPVFVGLGTVLGSVWEWCSGCFGVTWGGGLLIRGWG